MSDEISFDDFMKVDVRVGEILRAEIFAEARKPEIVLIGPDGPVPVGGRMH